MSKFTEHANRYLETLRLRCEGVTTAEIPSAAYMPSVFMFELMAIAQFFKWERDGVAHLMAIPLPPWDEALIALQRRVTTDPDSFFALRVFGELFELLLRAYFSTFDYSVEFDCKFLMGRVDDETLIEALANLLWSCRDQIAPSSSNR